MARKSIYAERTTLRTFLLALGVCAVGIALLALAHSWSFLAVHPGVQTIVKDVGSLLVATVTLALLWELFARRAFLEELLSETKLVDELRTTGLAGISAKWHGQIDWPALFNSSRSLDLFFAYGGTWRNTYIGDLRRFVEKPDTRATVVLADPDDERLLQDLGRRFNTSPADIRTRILRAKEEFTEVFQPAVQKGRDFSIWYLPIPPVFSCYFFDGTAIITLYKHKAQRAEVPTLVVKRGGELYDFFRAEFDAFVVGEASLARRVFPGPTKDRLT